MHVLSSVGKFFQRNGMDTKAKRSRGADVVIILVIRAPSAAPGVSGALHDVSSSDCWCFRFKGSLRDFAFVIIY